MWWLQNQSPWCYPQSSHGEVQHDQASEERQPNILLLPFLLKKGLFVLSWLRSRRWSSRFSRVHAMWSRHSIVFSKEQFEESCCCIWRHTSLTNGFKIYVYIPRGTCFFGLPWQTTLWIVGVWLSLFTVPPTERFGWSNINQMYFLKHTNKTLQ